MKLSKSIKLSIFGLVAAVALFQVADAQIFRRAVQRDRSVQVQRVVQPGPTVQGVCVDGSCGLVQSRSLIRSVRYDLPVTPVIQSVPAVRPAATPASRPTPAPTIIPVSSGQTFGLGEYSVLEAREVREVVIPEHVLAQIADEPIKTARDSFKGALLKTVAEQRKAGKISVRDAVKIRVALWSPAFVERAHELAVTQVAFNGEASDAVPVDDQGVVQVEGINWEGLAKFLEAILPLILSLLKAFGV